MYCVGGGRWKWEVGSWKLYANARVVLARACPELDLGRLSLARGWAGGLSNNQFSVIKKLYRISFPGDVRVFI